MSSPGGGGKLSAVRAAELRAASGDGSGSGTKSRGRRGVGRDPDASSPYASYSWVRTFTFVAMMLLFLAIVAWTLFGILIPRLYDGGAQKIDIEHLPNGSVVIIREIVKGGDTGPQGGPGAQGEVGATGPRGNTGYGCFFIFFFFMRVCTYY